MADKLTISGAGAHAAVALTDRIPASKDGVAGYHTLQSLRDDAFNPILGASGVAIPHTGQQGVEVVLATIPVPPLSANACLRVSSFWSMTASTNAKTLRHRLGGLLGRSFGTIGPTANVAVTWPFMTSVINNRGATNSQVGYAVRNRSTDQLAQGELFLTGDIQTNVATDLVITALLALGTETVTLESYLVELLVP